MTMQSIYCFPTVSTFRWICPFSRPWKHRERPSKGGFLRVSVARTVRVHGPRMRSPTARNHGHFWQGKIVLEYAFKLFKFQIISNCFCITDWQMNSIGEGLYIGLIYIHFHTIKSRSTTASDMELKYFFVFDNLGRLFFSKKKKVCSILNE